jgi:hypothetical protein
MKTIDTKSVLIGLLFGVCILLTLGAARGKLEDVGRYEIACPGQPNTCFVIDTTTGQLWQKHSRSSTNSYGSPVEWEREKKKIRVPTGLR